MRASSIIMLPGGSTQRSASTTSADSARPSTKSPSIARTRHRPKLLRRAKSACRSGGVDAPRRLHDDFLDGHVAVATRAPGAHLRDLVDRVHARNDAAEYRIA